MECCSPGSAPSNVSRYRPTQARHGTSPQTPEGIASPTIVDSRTSLEHLPQRCASEPDIPSGGTTEAKHSTPSYPLTPSSSGTLVSVESSSTPRSIHRTPLSVPSGVFRPPPIDTNPIAARVLIVDDSKVAQKLVARMLQSKCDTTIAANGWDAAKLAMEKPYDLILMDINMYANTKHARVYISHSI